MSGRASPEPSMASYDHYAPRTEKTEIINPEREARHRPPTQPGPQWSDSQQAWYPPPYHPQYPAAFPYGINYLPHPQAATQSAPARWDGFNPFDEEEQERRKKGKELVPVVPIRNGPPPWTGYEAGYGPGTFGPVGNPLWPALPPSQREPLLPLPSLADMGYNSKKPGKHVHHHDQWPGADRKRDFQRRPSEIKVNREIDGILTPSSGDLTVHLTMDLQEDLGDQLDEMARLSRLGHFLSAQAFFNENLKHHMDNPYVFIQYADMLLHQGDFKGLTLLKGAAMYKREEDMSNSDELSIRRVNHELRFLRANWELMQMLAKSHTLDTLSGAPDVFAEAVGILHDLAIIDDPSISSTEIQILALILQLTGHPVLNSKWLRYGSKALNAFPTSLSRLYPALLRQGRIWDFHDLVVLMPTIEDIKALTFDIFEKDLIPSFETIVSDWLDSVHGYDSSTTLALLSMMTHIILNPIQASEDDCIAIFKLCLPLAISVMENDTSNLKSRPYLRLLLAKSRFAETASRRAIDSLTSHLQSSPGVCYHPEIASLPVYVPSGNETPEWTPTDQPAELEDPVRLVLRSAVELGDLETEVLARQELIRLSSDPRDDMNKLFSLQLSHQGDLNGYSLSLASKYLVATTRQAKEELSISISRLLSRVASTDYWSPSREWILNMILYKLEGRSPSTIRHTLERSDSDYQYMDESLLQEISRKMPALKDWADSQVESRPETERKVSVLQPGPVLRRNNKPSARRGKSVATPRTVEKPRARTQPSAVYEPQVEPETPLMTVANPNNNLQDRHIPQHRPSPTVSGHVSTGGPQPMQPQVNNGHQEDARLVAKIKAKLEAEFNQRIEDEKESERQRREERMAILEGLKKEVEAIRREAVDQAEKKARVEAQERMEQLRWERHMEESKLQKEIEMAKAEAAASELDAKLKATREMAFREADKRMKEEFESRKMREAEARHQVEIETNKRIEAEKLAYEEAKAAEELKKQLRLKVEAELRDKQEAEHKAREEAAKKIAEEDHKEEVRKWATERAEKDLENENQIHLKDAVGRKIAIPFSQGRTWQGMEELIHAAFLHVDIVRPEVLAGHFDLIGPDGAIILPQVWDKTIQPGWTITMHMWPIAGPSGPGPLPPPPGGPPIPALHPPFPSSLPPRPAEIPNSEYVVVEEEEESDERLGMSDASSGYDTSMESSKPSRRARIASAFSSLKSTIFRRRRRHASLPSVISASVSESSVSESSAPSPRSSPRRSR